MISFLIKFPKKSVIFIYSIGVLLSAAHANTARDGAARAFQQRMDRVQQENNPLNMPSPEAPEFGEEPGAMPPPAPFIPSNRFQVPAPSVNPLQKMRELEQDIGSMMVKLDRLERKLNYLFQRQEEFLKNKTEESVKDKPKSSSKTKKRKKS